MLCAIAGRIEAFIPIASRTWICTVTALSLFVLLIAGSFTEIYFGKRLHRTLVWLPIGAFFLLEIIVALRCCLHEQKSFSLFCYRQASILPMLVAILSLYVAALNLADVAPTGPFTSEVTKLITFYGPDTLNSLVKPKAALRDIATLLEVAIGFNLALSILEQFSVRIRARSNKLQAHLIPANLTAALEKCIMEDREAQLKALISDDEKAKLLKQIEDRQLELTNRVTKVANEEIKLHGKSIDVVAWLSNFFSFSVVIVFFTFVWRMSYKPDAQVSTFTIACLALLSLFALVFHLISVTMVTFGLKNRILQPLKNRVNDGFSISDLDKKVAKQLKTYGKATKDTDVITNASGNAD
jgi:hypothetical protein